MPTLHITRGLPGSGKTTFARQWVARAPHARARVSRDDLRVMMYGTPVGLTQEQEDQVTTASQVVVSNFLALGLDVIADDTNHVPLHLAQWYVVAEQHYAGMEVHDMTTPVEECIARDAARERTVGADVIRHLADTFMPHGTYLPEDEDQCDAPGCTAAPAVAGWTGSGPVTAYCRCHHEKPTR